MDNAIPETPEETHQHWNGRVVIEGQNDGQYGRSYVTTLGGKKVWMNPGNQLVSEIVNGNTYDIKMSRKVGTKGWYIVEATLVGDLKPAKVGTKTGEQKATIEYKGTTPEERAKKDKSYSEGQNKGNYRGCLTQYICTCVTKGSTPNTHFFNTALKQGEKGYFEGYSEKEKESNPEADTPVATKVDDPYANLGS